MSNYKHGTIHVSTFYESKCGKQCLDKLRAAQVLLTSTLPSILITNLKLLILKPLSSESQRMEGETSVSEDVK